MLSVWFIVLFVAASGASPTKHLVQHLQNSLDLSKNRRFLVTIDIKPKKSTLPYKETHTGAIISPNYVLGTAPLRSPYKEPLYTVRVGSESYNQGGIEYDAELIQYEKPENGSSQEMNMMYQLNIALYKVKNPINLGYKAQPIGLYDGSKRTSFSSKATLRGWNPVDTHSGRRFRIRDIDVISSEHDQCNELIRVYCEGMVSKDVSKRQELEGILDRVSPPKGYSCATKSGHLSFVQADDYIFDGAALLRDNQLFGLLTGYSNFGAMYYMFVDVTFYRDWIKNVTGL